MKQSREHPEWQAMDVGFSLRYSMSLNNKMINMINTESYHTELVLKFIVFVNLLVWGLENHRCSPNDTLSLFTDQNSALYDKSALIPQNRDKIRRKWRQTSN